MAKQPQFKRYAQIQGGPVYITTAGSGQWYGDTLITSRDQVVAAPLVAAGSRIQLQPHWFGSVQSVNVAVSLVVGSVSAGSGFFISTTNSVGFSAISCPSIGVWWTITNPR